MEGLPRCPLPLEVALCDDEWDNWARNQLMAAGSDLLGKVYNVQVYFIDLFILCLFCFRIFRIVFSLVDILQTYM